MPVVRIVPYLETNLTIRAEPNHSARPIQKLRGTPPNNRNLQQEDLCASIIAIALTPDESTLQRNRQQARNLQVVSKASKLAKTSSPTASPTPKPTVDESVSTEELGEQFVCERASTGEMLPLIGSEEQMAQLREALNSGQFISAESTLVGLSEEDLESVKLPDDTTDEGSSENNNPFAPPSSSSNNTETVVSLPPGTLQFKPGNGQHSLKARSLAQRELAVYAGTKKVLFVKVTDENGLAHPDSAKIMSDKIFGTYGDDTTVKDQFEKCSFGDLKISNNYDLGKAEAAPGVIEVTINISLKSSSRSQIQE